MALHYGALLLDCVDEHDSTTTEITKFVERGDRRADRRVGVRCLRNRKAGLLLRLRVNGFAKHARHTFESPDEAEHRTGLFVERLGIDDHGDHAVTFTRFGSFKSDEVDAELTRVRTDRLDTVTANGNPEAWRRIVA